jgi:AcrR family transcriptional regulator
MKAATRKKGNGSAGAGGKRAENRERTKQQILKAALELFSKKGFYNTTTKQISDKAKIAEGTLFNYFRTKEDLALYFFEQEVEELIRWYDEQTELKDAAVAEKLFAIIYRHLDRMSPYEEFIGAVYLRALQPVSKLSPLSLQSQSVNLRYLNFIRGILAEAEDDEKMPRLGDIGAYGFGLFHMTMVTYWLQDKSPGKEKTLALLDRTLKVGSTLLRKGGWEW